MTSDEFAARLDRLVLAVAPQWGLRRARARAAAQALQRHFDAAAFGRRTLGWSRRHGDANAATRPVALATLRELSRDLRRNNGWARRAVQIIGNNVVGWGIEARPIADSEQLAQAAADLWERWSYSLACDYDGRMPFVGLQRLVMETVVESGEALIVRERANSGDGLPVPVRVRVLEPDYLDTNRDGKLDNGGEVTLGIEKDSRGRRVAYWLHQTHPGSLGGAPFTRNGDSKRVPAADVIHVYATERAGQVRGVPWLTAAIARLHDLDEYDDAKLMQSKIAACFAAFVEDVESLPGVGIGEPGTAGGGTGASADEQLEVLEPGTVSYLQPGRRVSFAQPPSASEHGPISATALRRIATSIGGITYEELTGDYSQVNFSSARMARQAQWLNVEAWRWLLLIPQLCDGVWSWVMELAARLEGWPAVPRVEWSPPPMPMLEPEKEGLAYQRLMRSGVVSLAGAIRERGGDPRAHLEEIAHWNAELDRLGIVLDSDPRRVSTSGQTQRTAEGGEGEGGEANAGDEPAAADE